MTRLAWVSGARIPTRWYRAGIIGVALLALLWLGIPSAFAHAVPVLSSPRPNAILETAPSDLSIRFNEPVVPELSHIELLSQAGQMLPVGDVVAIDAENRTLAVSLPTLVNGAYLVSWRVLSAVDGHTTTGTFSFGIGVTSLSVDGEAATVVAQQSFLSAAARWLNLTGTALLLGLVAFRLFILNPIMNGIDLEPEEEQLDLDHASASLKIGGAGALVIVAALLLTFVDQINAYNLFQSGNIQTWLSTRFGTMWLTRLLLTVAFAFLLTNLFMAARAGRRELQSWKWWAGLFLGLSLALTTSLVSHSAALSIDTSEAIIVDFIHAIAASFWVGGLIYLAMALRQARLLPDGSRVWFSLSLLLNFSALAAIAVGSLITSGGYLAWQHIGSWTTLVGTSYGLTLLAKIALALPAFGMAAINLLVIKPRLATAYEEENTLDSNGLLKRFQALVGIETALALLILAAAGILTDLQRGKDAPLLADAPGKTTVTASVDDLEVNLSIEPALIGQNRFDIYLVDGKGDPVTDASEVSLRYTFLGQSIGADEGEATPGADGHYVLEGSYISLIGTWQVEVAIRRPGAFDTFAPFRLEAGLGGNIRPLESGARPLERFAKLMVLAGGGATGIFLVLFAIGWGFIAVRAAKSEWQLLPLLVISLLLFWLGASQLLDFFGQEFTPARFVTNPVLPDAASVATGQALYEAHCASCHGLEGRGDGPNAASLPSPPADFGSGHTAIHPDGDLYFWIREGIADTQMPAFGEQFTREEVWHLVNYVRRLSAQASQPD